jgi:hypothetical protein
MLVSLSVRDADVSGKTRPPAYVLAPSRPKKSDWSRSRGSIVPCCSIVLAVLFSVRCLVGPTLICWRGMRAAGRGCAGRAR